MVYASSRLATQPGAQETRGVTNGEIVETGRSAKARASFVGHAPRVWNKAPLQITTAKSLQIAKRG